MKKIILLLTLAFTLGYSQVEAQCAYTYTQSGSNVTFSHSWPLATIYSLDSIRMDFGDGNTFLHSSFPMSTTNHTYTANGTYNACLTRYISTLAPNSTVVCTYCDSITIGQTSSCSTSISLASTNTSITATANATGGTAPYFYSYTLNPGNVNNTTGLFTNLTPGPYTVCVIALDAMQNICSTACDSTTIGNVFGCNTNIAATSNANSITAIATGAFGTPPYTYSYTLNPGNITNTTGIFNGLTLGVYSVCATATDAMNQTCTADCDSISAGISFVCNTTLSLNATGNAIIATPTTTGGTAPYTYSYNLNPGNITNSTGIFNGLANGQYTICVTSLDAFQNQCSSACDSATVGTLVGCNTAINVIGGTSGIFANATASFGTAPYTYSYTLNPGNITNTTGNFTGLGPGTYIVCATATDAMQQICTTNCDSASVTPPTTCATFVNASVSGTTVSAIATANFGTPPYTYSYTLNPGNIVNNTGVFTGLAPGPYAVCVTATDVQNLVCTPDCDSTWVGNGQGNCFATAQFTQTINGLNVMFLNNTTVAGGTLTSSNWSFGDGNFSTANAPTHTYASPGLYTVTLGVTGTDANNNACGDSTLKQMTLNYPSAVNDININSLNIYPNPTANNFSIELKNGEKMENLLITDVAGRKIETNYTQLKNNLISVSLVNQASGIYFIKLQTNSQLYTSSIMKQE